jgi:hypothetical protein
VPKTAAGDFLTVLRTLREHGVEFVVVGGVGAVLQGAAFNTFVLEIVHSTGGGQRQQIIGRTGVAGCPLPDSAGKASETR